jgi:hypothetical protein
MGREVALKLSAERFSDGFEREVRAVAVLNHPTSTCSTTSELDRATDEEMTRANFSQGIGFMSLVRMPPFSQKAG